jgi:hypothetical protein
MGVGAVSTVRLQPSEPAQSLQYDEMAARRLPTWSPWHPSQCAPGRMLGVSRARSCGHILIYRKDHGGRSLRQVCVHAQSLQYDEMAARRLPTWSPWHPSQCAPGRMLGVSRARSCGHILIYRKDHGGRSLRQVCVHARGSRFLLILTTRTGTRATIRSKSQTRP